MVGRRRPLLREICTQIDSPLSQTTTSNRYSLVAPQPEHLVKKFNSWAIVVQRCAIAVIKINAGNAGHYSLIYYWCKNMVCNVLAVKVDGCKVFGPQEAYA